MNKQRRTSVDAVDTRRGAATGRYIGRTVDAGCGDRLDGSATEQILVLSAPEEPARLIAERFGESSAPQGGVNRSVSL